MHYDRKKFYFKNTIKDCDNIYKYIKENLNLLSMENENFTEIYKLSRQLYDEVRLTKNLNVNKYIDYLYKIYPIAKKKKYNESYKFFLKFLVNSPATIYTFYTYYKHLKEKLMLPTLKKEYLYFVLGCIQNEEIKRFYNTIFDLRKFKRKNGGKGGE